MFGSNSGKKVSKPGLSRRPLRVKAAGGIDRFSDVVVVELWSDQDNRFSDFEQYLKS